MNKKHLLIGVVLVAVVVLAVLMLRGGETKVKNCPSSGTEIIAFGDSLVAGVGASAPEKNFVSLLSAKIGRPIVNLGVSGDTTASGLGRINALDVYRPQVVLLLLSGNDRLRQIPPEQTLENLTKIIQNIQSRGAVVIVLGVKGNLFSGSFEGQVEDLAKQNGAAFVPDVLDGLFGDAKYMSDTIHPNDAGYAKIADRIFPVLEKYSK